MVLFFIWTLGISIAGLGILISLKRWELNTGRVLWGGLRPRVDGFFRGVILWSARILPALVRIYGKWAWRALLALTHRLAAWAVLETERLLERTLHLLRHSTDVRRGVGEASAFLREVAEHKKELLKNQGLPDHRARVQLHKEQI